MPRSKQYNEQEVIEKAMNLFWRNGYETTSMHMLEKEMGINKFSIYSSFGNKNGVFLESIKCYKSRLAQIVNKLNATSNGVAGLKQFFYDFIEFSKEKELGKGCLIVNTANEMGGDAHPKIQAELTKFTTEVKEIFANKLNRDIPGNAALIERQADYLIISMFGLASASRMFNKSQVENYIENIFKNL